MALRLKSLIPACAILALAATAFAQDSGTIAPLPKTDDSLQRIAPLSQDPKDAAILSTKPVADAPAPNPDAAAPAPVQATAAPIAKPAPAPSPFGRAENNGSNAPVSAGNKLPMSSPFGHADAPAPVIPSGPHPTTAIPVVGVDAVESSEPAPPTPVAAGANPAAEDPAAPTEFTSPIFTEAGDGGGPRKIVFRVLNKVTAQSQLFKTKPGESVSFGRLDITSEMCRVSAPNSQEDFAGLLDIKERLPGKDGVKALFHGWMYASSPSITGLEHPIYDVTMVTCETASEQPKLAKKAGNSKKK